MQMNTIGYIDRLWKHPLVVLCFVYTVYYFAFIHCYKMHAENYSKLTTIQSDNDRKKNKWMPRGKERRERESKKTWAFLHTRLFQPLIGIG